MPEVLPIFVLAYDQMMQAPLSYPKSLVKQPIKPMVDISAIKEII